MEKNWIKEIIEFIRNAMNEGLRIDSLMCRDYYHISIKTTKDSFCKVFNITICKDNISIGSPTGFIKIKNKLSERDELEIRAIILSIKEYNEDMAISEFENFFKKDDKPTTIDNLDDDD